MGKAVGRASLGSEEWQSPEFGLGCVKFEISSRHPGGDVE